MDQRLYLLVVGLLGLSVALTVAVKTQDNQIENEASNSKPKSNKKPEDIIKEIIDMAPSPSSNVVNKSDTGDTPKDEVQTFVDNVVNKLQKHFDNVSKTLNTTQALSTTPSAEDVQEKEQFPEKGAQEQEHHYSMTIFFILLVIAMCILVIHLLIQTKFHYLPESIAIVLVGALLGLFLKLLAYYKVANWQTEEHFPPTMFFLILLPPIIFESGYNLHKGNFFQNIGTILLFAIFGTVISAVVVGAGLYLLGKADLIYPLTMVESFAFGSLVSAVDPVATLAIFQALDVEPILYMLVFGESMLNDAVSIVLTTSVLQLASPAMADTSGAEAFFTAVGSFCLMFFASAAIGVAFGLFSAMISFCYLKHFIDLRKTPSLEIGMMFVFSYLPYGLSEGLHLSGIMAILFCGIVMSHYTHLNLSPITQITMQQAYRTISFIAETCVFAYLGLAIFSFSHNVKPAFVIWSIVLILLGRAFNIFPLSFIANYFREHKITRRMQFIMWFSGLRGAIAFALSLHMEFDVETRTVLLSTTLIIILFTLIFLGGSTMPLMKVLKTDKRKKTRPGREVTLSKTKEFGETVDSEHLSELTEEEYEVNYVKPHLKGFVKLDIKYLVPFFTRRLTKQENFDRVSPIVVSYLEIYSTETHCILQEVRDGKNQMNTLTNKWYQEVRAAPSDSEEEVEQPL
ncbi:hypothetical protein LSH36_224g04013 [Paralvinella palmiformis]|uniref:Sodium/hydrogen exchanger n=1 Tax=Paralvinella palmiformis TaxID=53620 RepID=A0AAD9JQ02_9ANNE|nr:hypothetical protein LSH36_224g04013 [Paralvinella palmiformis]